MRSVHVDTARTWRGGQNQVLLTVTGLAELGDKPLLVAHEAGELRRRAGEGLRFVGISPRSEFDVQAGWRLARILGDVRPEVLHAHDPMAVSLAAMALQMSPGTPRPLVVASRRVDFHLKQHAFSKWKYRHVDVFIAASQAIADILAADGIAPDRVDVVHDGVNIAFIDKQPAVNVHEALWLPAGAPLVGNVAALASHKGQRHLVAAAALVLRDIPDARFLIVGEGELRGALERQIRDLGLERRVQLTGFRPDAIGIIKSLDVFVLSSVTEGLGSVLLEAMTSGRAIVGTRAGGIPEVIRDGKTGLLVAPTDEAGLAKAIRRLLRDQSLRERLGAAARTIVEQHFSVDALVSGTRQVYERRLRGRGAEGEAPRADSSRV
jgi:glycosyltransferase involved in cell wall biosynthesis